MAAHAEPSSAAQRDSPLDSAITKKMLLLFIIGDILGGGIYARTGEVAGEIGGAIWTGFALAAIVAAFTAASYAELVSKYPQAAGAALYIHRAWAPLPYLGIVTCAALAVHSILDDPQLLLWAGGLIALGLVLWVIERAVR